MRVSSYKVLAIAGAISLVTTIAPAQGRGDINDDGAMDIADAVYLLNHLFVGGPPPPPLELLPDTGQDECFDLNGPVPCTDPVWSGQDGALDTGWWVDPAQRWIDNGDGTVTDTMLGLQWRQGVVAIEDWAGALAHCDALVHAGHEDWRLPNVRELYSLVQFQVAGFGQPTPLAFPAVLQLDQVAPGTPLIYWTSTTAIENAFLAYVVMFEYGQTQPWVKVEGRLVTAVRTID